MLNEFKEFALEGNALGLTIDIILGDVLLTGRPAATGDIRLRIEKVGRAALR